jgi:hypothetical protein
MRSLAIFAFFRTSFELKIVPCFEPAVNFEREPEVGS